MTQRRCSAAASPFALVAAFVVACSLAGPAAPAEVFEVRGVKVDVTAESAAAAREKAIAEGEVRAFQQLIRRLAQSADPGRLPSLDREQISALVVDFSVAEERTSAVRYIASLDFRFNADEVRRLLAEGGVDFAVTQSRPVVVLPVLSTAGALSLWDDPNPWRQAWEPLDTSDALVPIVIPAGDLADIAAIGAEQAAAADGERLIGLARRYGTADTLVAVAAWTGDGHGGAPALVVTYARFTGAQEDYRARQTIRGEAGEAPEAVLARAVDSVNADVQTRWKTANLLAAGESAVAAVTVPVAGLGDWLSVRARLQRTPMVQRVDLVLLSRNQVRVNLHYLGSAERLAQALRQTDLELVRGAGEWILKPLRPSAPRPS